MRIPLSLLKSFIHLDLPLAKIAETLTLLGIEVDAILNETPTFSHVIVGEILSVAPHGSAEKLQIAQVSDGIHRQQVVCGAENCRAGIKTAFAKIGARLTDQDGKTRTIEKAMLRGVESNGMLCSASELHLWNDHGGILELPKEWTPGQELAPLLLDPVFELSLTPNLGHCLSALGIARELGAALQKPIHRSKEFPLEHGTLTTREKIQITVHDPHLCPRYMGRLIEGVKIGPSPFWLQQTLLSCGMKPICNAVDITNYILIKLGQPLHAFDFDRLEGSELEVAAAETTLPFLGLDGVARQIVPGTLLISDAKKPVAIAGVLGGENSAVNEKTVNIFLEAALFDPITVRKGAKKMGIRTESALRFEKGVDPNGVEAALDEAALLIEQVCHGKISKGKIDIKKGPFPHKQIFCRPERINQLLGTQLSKTEIEELFRRLQLKATPHEKGALQVEIPTYRFDLSEEIDLVEEIARLYGYNNIKQTAPRAINAQIPHDPVYLFTKELRQRLVGLGLQEFLNSDLISPKLASLAIETTCSKVQLLKALHAKTEEYSVLRPSLLPGMLQSAKRNLDQRTLHFSAFEIGRIHFNSNEKLVEMPMLALLLTGKNGPNHWSLKAKEYDFYDLKGLLENLFEALNLNTHHFDPSSHLSFHPKRQANISANGMIIGSFGELHPNVLEMLDLKQRVFYAEIHVESLRELQRRRIQMTPLPSFPSSERDWTLPLASSTPIDTVFQAIEETKSPLLEKVELIDLYYPEGSSEKNATFRFTYRDLIKTVSYEEVETTHHQLMEKVSKLLAK